MMEGGAALTISFSRDSDLIAAGGQDGKIKAYSFSLWMRLLLGVWIILYFFFSSKMNEAKAGEIKKGQWRGTFLFP